MWFLKDLPVENLPCSPLQGGNYLSDKNSLLGWVEYIKKGIVCKGKKSIDDY
jgi:hypothetical protein